MLVISLSLLAGCGEESKVDPLVASIGQRILLSYGIYDLAGKGNLNEFALLLAEKPLAAPENKLLNKGVFNGYVAALIPPTTADGQVEIVFRDGSVFGITGVDFSSLKQIYEGAKRLEFVTAARVGGSLLGFAREQSGAWGFYTFSKEGWQKSTMDIPMLPIAEIGVAQLVEYKAKPVIFWLELSGRKIDGRIRAAEYTTQGWKELPAVGERFTGIGSFGVCSTAESILLVQDIGGQSKTPIPGLPFYEYQGREGGWRSIASIPFSTAGLARTGFGVDIFAGAEKLVAVRSDEAGLELLYAVDSEEGIWKPLGEFAAEEKTILDYFNSDMAFNYFLIGLSLFLLGLMLIRRRRLQTVIQRSQGSGAELPKDARLSQLLKETRIQRIGGFATLIDRGFALLIDALLLLPIPYYYINTQRADFMDSVFTAEEYYTFFIWLGALSLYTFVAEMIFGQTVGKAAARIRVRSAIGGRIRPSQALVRNVARFIDFFPVPLGGMRIWYLIAAVAASVTPRRQRVGDLLAKTVVRRYVPLTKRKIVLASASPRRKELLSELGLEFDIRPAHVDETYFGDTSAREFVKLIAVRKANEVVRGCAEGELVIAADTVVALEGKVLGKPQNSTHARQMLQSLSGRTHEVLSGVCIVDTATKQLLAAVESTEVKFRELSVTEIEEYIASGEGEDKAGSYAIQGEGGRMVQEVLGSTSNVIGMPMELVQRMFKDLDAS